MRKSDYEVFAYNSFWLQTAANATQNTLNRKKNVLFPIGRIPRHGVHSVA